ncbi:MAG: hypothetical protein LBK42_04970 [Propionibacteriaceae bacterium]|jgi:antitoxin component of RelBE/YafQ-DinJ toxin-antitoxin module|nr:hypothetical protein [Propionibacteriaceae bacterium]
MGSTVLNVKLDADLKRAAQELAKSLGLPLSAVVSSSLRAFVVSGEITFRAEERLRPEVEAELLELSASARAGDWDDFSPALEGGEEALSWLRQAVAAEGR